MDLFSKLAHLIEEGKDVLKSQLKYAEMTEMKTALEKLGLQLEKVFSHFSARSLLMQNQSALCLPFVVQVNQEYYPAELHIQKDRNSHHIPSIDSPSKITLSMETKNLGRVQVDLATFHKDMNVLLKVTHRRIKEAMEPQLNQLRRKLEKQAYHVQEVQCKVELDLESRQSILLPPKQTIRSLKRIEGIV